ncbi:MFS transporter [Prevotella sp. KH2C16]|uniref:MFS transporter n=1 Tax=Prevotella sp. KH2C16 TaxID=1855325 RepID=UPI0008E4BA4B|nr:MFS transporter [Prevotella sp. KH2C16]SFG32849.1 MFS transporter, YQGE family, putative transporter [Prevotella sp. KH2C16]
MNRLTKELQFFRSQEHNMKVLLLTNMIYAFVLPVVEIFAGAYVMRNTNDPAMVAYYQLAMYVGVVSTSLVNGLLLKLVKIKILYAAGILISGVSLGGMMLITNLGFVELGLAGFLLGAASGFFWTNRYLLALYNTDDGNRNYYFGLESFFFSVANITVPLVIGAFIGGLDGMKLLGTTFDANFCYKIVMVVVVLITIISVSILWRGNFVMPKDTSFIHFRFHVLWRKMLTLASLKGMVQGFLVTAPAILVMRFVGEEGALGTIQGISGALTAILVYVLGRIARPQDRLWILLGSVLVFFVGTLFNGLLFSAIGVIMFVLCKVIFQPLFDLAYYPVMMKTIDVVAKIEKRNEYTYIMTHEVGLFCGRFLGLGLFILLAYLVSEDFALKYALIIVAGLQTLTYPLAKNITKSSDEYAKNL